MQSGSAAPQPTPNSLPPLPAPTQPAMATLAELEAAVAALTDKKRRLREAFDRLVACSPVPVPFRWEDLDAHLASIAASFSHLDSIHADAIAIAIDGAAAAAAAAAAAGGGPSTAAHHVEHPDEEERDRERRVGRGASEEGQGSSNAVEGEDGGDASLHQERGEEVQEASIARPDREPDEAGNILGVEPVPIEEAPEQLYNDDDEEDAMGAIVASPHHRDDDIEMVGEEEEAVNASAGREGHEDEAEEGEWLQHPHAAAGGGETALARAVAAACANMDPSALVDALCLGGRSSSSLRAFLPALLGAPDPHTLLVRAVGGLLDLASAGRDASEWWANCVALIECAPRLAAPSPDALAQAKRLVGRWKEMAVAGPAGAGGRDMGGMAGWGLLTFIASYNIVPEFDADEIIRLFGDIAPQVKDNCVELCKRLGLIEKMTGIPRLRLSMMNLFISYLVVNLFYEQCSVPR